MTPWNKGKKGLFFHTLESKQKMAGRKPWNFGLHTGIDVSYDHYDNGRKYCTICMVYYNKEQYDTFKNPYYCKDCGRKLRSVPRGRLGRVYAL